MDDDPVLAVLPLHYSNSLFPNLHLHQFPLLFRPLQVPPSAAESGKFIRARYKPRAGRIEVHVPVDTRKEVWNPEKGFELGAARVEDDQQGVAPNQQEKTKWKDGNEPRLSDVRMSSEMIPERGAYMLGIVRDGHLHLHPISQTHQFRPALAYLDMLSRKSRRSHVDDNESNSEGAPPPDPEDPTPTPAAPLKKREKRASTEAREVYVTAKKSSEDKTGSQQFQGGMTQVRRDMLMTIRDETEEPWEELIYYDGENVDSEHVFESVFSKDTANLVCKTELVDMLKGIGN